MNIQANKTHIGLYAIVFGVLFWPIETLIHVFIFNEGTFFDAFFSPEINEAWMRLLTSASFIAFGLYTHRAIQEQRELNKILRQQKARIRGVIDSAHDAYISINSASVITDWNPMAEKMFGWSRNEAIGKTLLESIIPDRFHQAHNHGMKNYLKSGSGPWLYRTTTTTARHKNGNEFDVEMAIVPLASGDEQEFYAFIRHSKQMTHSISTSDAGNR